MNRKNALIIFVKAPKPGTVKTRMQPQLSPEQSLSLYRAMGLDLVRTHRDNSSCDLIIHFWPPEGLADLQSWLGADLAYHRQNGADLGKKMHHAFVSTFEDGYEKVVIIGSDLPDLSVGLVEQALAKLDDHQAVFGPTDDGGYYLIGLNKPAAPLFDNVEWSTGSVLAQTLTNARNAGIDVALLEYRADIDTFFEARQLWERLNNIPAAASDMRIPNTWQVLQKIFS